VGSRVANLQRATFQPPEIAVARSYANLPQIPDNIRSDLLRLVEHAEKILSILRETKAQKPSTSAQAFVRLFVQHLSISYNEAGRLLNALQNLLSIDQELGDVEKTFELITTRLTPDVREKWFNKKIEIKAILELLKDDHPAAISFKAQRLSHSYERVLIEAEILTDARPVYTIKGDKIVEMMIQHKLVITQHDQNNTHGELYFVMDARDVVNLKKACDRAIQKAKVLKDSLANLPWVTEIVRDDDDVQT
jgi:hypothetical protein